MSNDGAIMCAERAIKDHDEPHVKYEIRPVEGRHTDDDVNVEEVKSTVKELVKTDLMTMAEEWLDNIS